MEASEQVDSKRAQYSKKLEPPSPAIYHSQAVLDLLKGIQEPHPAARFEDMRVSFRGENRGIQAAEYHGSIHFTSPSR